MKSRFLVETSDRLVCDALVIGTGAGGSSVAGTLAAAGRDVLMLEEGPYISSEDAPVGLAQSTQKMWRGAGLLSTLGPSQIAFAEGKCVGGGTEINSAIFQRAPDEIIENWVVANHLRDFSAAALQPYYERAASLVNASLTQGETGAPTEILRRAGDIMGWKVSALERAQRRCVGTNMCASGCPTGGKQSMSATLIPYALAHGARMVSECRVHRLCKRGTRVVGAVGTATDADGRRRRVDVTASQIFLCAGTTQTPSILQRSGLGRGVGRGFQLHPTVRVLARFREPVQAHRYRVPLAAITEFVPDMRFGGSVFSIATYAVALAEDWACRRQWLTDYPYYAMYYAMIKPDGVGRVLSVPGVHEPIVTYRLTERDWRRLGEATRMLSLALLASGAEHVVPSVRGHEGWHTPDGLRRNGAVILSPRHTILMSIHLFGSCPIGENTEFFPVDSFGRLVAAENVIVADGSSLPSAPGVNPQATIMALAFRAADRWLSSYA
jgi:choline dehydrogenase-like flavoprotein